MKKSLLQNVILVFTCLLIANCFALATSSLLAQSPQGIPYQAVMRNADGSVMANSAVSLTFMIHDGTANGTVVYQESHSLTSNAQGLVSCVVGNGVESQGSFSNINWGSGAKFLHVMMGTTDLGTQQLMSVPYALYAGACDIQVSLTGDTLYTGGGNFVIIPGISAANFPPAVLGCTDNAACNYSSAATQNDNSCLYTGATCDDGNANTTNDVINGSCVCAGTQTSGSGTGAQLLPGNATCSVQNISVTGCGGQTSLTYDGRTYDLVEIGGQCWFADNLATDQYRNGDLIPTGLSNTAWGSTTSGAYAIYNNDPVNDLTYGKLYNWYTTVDSRGLCPTGWHVPTDCEWMYLEGSLGLSITDQETVGWRGTNEGGAMKATTNWASPNTGATNSSGFTGLPGGYRNLNGSYNNFGNVGYWWSSSEYNSNYAWYRLLNYYNSNVYRSNSNKQLGFSVRCLRD